ncbi:MAG TPA: zinc ribbon domain-containing protein [Opitutaceae bacterium]|nr:zinc ribbon domain-containing protein [Opitutaceae bacterium]
MSRPPPPETCAQCGATIPPRAQACPECGADERTGWREASIYDGLDLPGGYDEDEPSPSRPRRQGLAWHWWLVAVLLLVLLVAGALTLR